MAAKIFAIINQKGGVGKTTTTVNLGSILAREYGKRVLLVDLDTQGSMTSHVGVDGDVDVSIYDVLVNGVDPREAIREAGGIWALPSSKDLAGAEIELPRLDVAEWSGRLRSALDGLRDEYDLIFLDCPPSLGVLTVLALAAADFVLVAMEAEYLALRGVGQLMDTVNRVSGSLNPELQVFGVLFCMYDSRVLLARQVRDEVEKFFPGRVFRTLVRRNVRLAEAPSFGVSIIDHDARSAGAEDYRAVAREFLERCEPEVALVEGDIMAETRDLTEPGDRAVH